jgi:geranylgeranyl diphosphate synthase type I
MISDRVADALAALDTAPIDQVARRALTDLAVTATHRRA